MTLELRKKTKKKTIYTLVEEKNYGLINNRLAYPLILKFVRKHEKTSKKSHKIRTL